MIQLRKDEGGFSLVEMVTALGVFSIIAISILGLYSALVSSTVLMKQKSVALTVATNQLEYVKSLPFSSLAVSGGSIYSTNPIPSTKTETINKVQYTVKTSINYVDDAFDGCGSYPNTDLKNKYCRNQPSPTGSTTDTNPQDYKIVNITVLSRSGSKLAETDTQIAAKVAETASTTGALFITVIDDNGNPISGSTVKVVNPTTNPATNLSDNTDSNGVAIFYGLVPDSSFDYVLSASKDGYSSLSTIASSGTLQPNYPNIKVLTQQSSHATLTIMPQGTNSLLVEATDTNGAPVSGARIYMKGGYKRYTATTNTSYYYDNLSPSDSRPTTDSAGLAAINNLVPGPYLFCGDEGSTSCVVGGSTRYLVAAIPYEGANSLNPITVPTQAIIADPGTPHIFGSSSYLQKVRLMFSTSSSFPRVNSLKPDNLSLASASLSSFAFQVIGNNLPCSTSAASCNTSVVLKSGATTYPASCTGSSDAKLLNCRVNLTGVPEGMLQMSVTAYGQTLNLPALPMKGGINVLP